jgi:tRNA (cmo5U34)-methyltransferase
MYIKPGRKKVSSKQQDQIYATPQEFVDTFVFDGDVADVFSDMIERSVPGYQTTISTIGVLAARFATPGSRCYDLGCSLGAATLAMRHSIAHDDCSIIAVDNSPAMVSRCRKTIERDHSRIPVEVLEADLRNIEIENASVVIMNFTLQFIDPNDRQSIIDKVYAGLKPGGLFVLSEKVVFSDPQVDQLHIEMHHAFKRSMGYSDLEIAQKRTALENILIPDTLGIHRRRLETAGFSSSDVWFQCFNFASLLALKGQEL